MDYYKHHITAWRSACQGLTLEQEGAYLRLVSWVYKNESALPADIKTVYRIAGVITRSERAAVQYVLGEFFKLMPHGYVNARCEQEMQFALSANVSRFELKNVSKVKQQKYRDERACIFEALRQKGVIARFNLPMRELRAMLEQASLPERYGNEDVTLRPRYLEGVTVTRPVTVPVTDHVTATPNTRRNVVGTFEKTLDSEEKPPGAGAALAPGAAASASRRMRQQGMQAANPSDPRLIEALALGVTEDDLATCAALAVAQGKPFAYAIAMSVTRHRDGIAVRARGQEGIKTGPGAAKPDRLRGWVRDEFLDGPAASRDFVDAEEVPNAVPRLG